MENKDLFKKDGFVGEWKYILPTEAFIDYVANEIVSRLYLTDVGYFPEALHHYRERPEGISENIYIYCMKGQGHIVLKNGLSFSLKENEAFCIPAQMGHKYFSDNENPWTILWLHFKGSDSLFYPINELKVVHFKSKATSATMMSLFNQLYQVLGQNYCLGNFITITNIISLILSTTYMSQQNDDTNSEITTRAIRFMYDNLDKALSLDDLSATLKVSKSYLSAQFKKHTGQSPIDFFNKLKIDEACKLLRSTDLYTYEISSRLGISDQYYFSRLFKKTTGCSPREYRRNQV